MLNTIIPMFQHVAACAPGVICTDSLPHAVASKDKFSAILSIVFATLGGVSVLVVIIGGIKYAGSQGDPAGIAKAKSTIIYALVGIVVAVMAVIIVQFTVQNVFGP